MSGLKNFLILEIKQQKKSIKHLIVFIANKSFLNSQDPLGNNALHLAIINQDIPTANKLVASGIDYKAKNFDGLTYLDIARSHGNEFFQSFTRSFAGPTSNEEITNQSARNSRDDSLILASIPELPEDHEDQIPSDFGPLPSPTETSRSRQNQSIRSQNLSARTA